MFIYLASVAIVLLLAYVAFGKKKNLPPGPYGLPLLGYAPFVGKNPILTMTKLKKKYGNVVKVQLGTLPVIVLNDYEAIKEAYVKQGETFSGRPYMYMQLDLFENNDIIFTDGPLWKQHRRFSLQTLRDFGVGKTSLETIVMEQVDTLTEHLATKNGKPVQINDLFFVSVMNVIWGLCAGKTFDINDEYVRSFKTTFDDISEIKLSNIIDFIPILRYIIPGELGYNKTKRSINKIRQYLTKEVDNHIEKFEESNMTDFIDFYLAKIFAKKKEEQEIPPFNKSGLVNTVFNLFNAGSDTTSTSLSWGILYLALRPEIQRKVQEELDKNIAKDSYMSPASKSLIPYTEATLLEIQRFATIVPLGVPHRATKDTTLMGYDIPKDSTIFSNLHAVHHDEKYWGDPEVFRPERFLDESGKVKTHDHLMPFSAGPRMCLGESLAKLELFLFFSTMLRRFTFELNPNEPKPTEQPVVGGVFKPRPFSCIIKCR